MVTKGYGLTVSDIDGSCPSDLEPYAKAHKLEVMENDQMIHAICGNYIMSAVSVAIDHCFSGEKAKSKYIQEPLMSKEFENYGMTEEEIYEKEMKKALLVEERWMMSGKQKGLPETII